jgi:ABC-type phosphate transport system substrate-binding protein
MRTIKLTAVGCFLAGLADAQPHNHLQGSDTLAAYTRQLITALGLDSQLTYVGAGSTLGIQAAIRARTDIPSQRVNPATRFVNDVEIGQAAANNLEFVDYVLGLDAVLILVNDDGNPSLTRMAFSDARQVWQCNETNWSQVPGSDRTDSILVLALEEFRDDTHDFVDRIGGFYQLPPDGWWSNYGCVNVCVGDGCTQIIGTFTASIPSSIGYSRLPGLMSGNRDLSLCDDSQAPGTCTDTDYVRQSVTTIRDRSYPLSRRLHMYKVRGITDSFGPEGPQTALVVGSMDPNVTCPLLAQNRFIPVFDGFCP